MEIPVILHKDENSVYGVTVPDVPGCFSYGETIAEALRNTKEAVRSHLELLLEEGERVDLVASSVDELVEREEFAGGILALLDIDLTKLDTKPERINISMPRFVLSRIDAFAADRHETRSGLLARAALRLIAEETRSQDVSSCQG